jgi:hypothetical protein
VPETSRSLTASLTWVDKCFQMSHKYSRASSVLTSALLQIVPTAFMHFNSSQQNEPSTAHDMYAST